MAHNRVELSERIRQRIAECEADVREILYGAAGCPVWGTSFAEIEKVAMSVGEELSRRFMSAAAAEQVNEMPPEALVCEEEQAVIVGQQSRPLETEAGRIEYETPKAYLPKSRRAFFPQEKALGMAIDEELSPAVQQQVTRQGARLHGFEKARASLADFGYEFTSKRVERQTERIGAERVTERDAVVERYQNLTLMEKCQPPEGVEVPEVVSVGDDGGRLQTTTASEKGTHWHQYMAADLRVLESELLAADPEPDLPEVFRQPKRMGKLVSEISHKITGTDAPPDPDDEARNHAAESRETDAVLSENASEKRPKSRTQRINQPKTVSREVLASRKLTAPEFGILMAACAWSMGFFQAKRKGFVGDGQAANWNIWEKQFKPYGFVPILDFIHALTYIYNAAMAGRSTEEGWTTYLKWITAVWQGRVREVIAELQARQQELGPPLPEHPDTNPRNVVAKSLTYLENQQDRMNYPEYRRQGLAITSCHIESTIKQLNYRVKGSEMFWSDDGVEALLQLSADLLCDSTPLKDHWSRRATRMTGFRVYCRSKT